MNLRLYLPVLFLMTRYQSTTPSKVFELSDRFSEIHKNGGVWLVKFYAPWCGHCKKLEPLWMHVAQALTRTNIKVGKVDVTRFPSLATEYKAYATPTIKFIKPDVEHTYNGERSEEALIDYALRMAGPPVQEIKQPDSVGKLKKQNQLFFTYVGDRKGPLWDVYFSIAKALQPYAYFYSVNEAINKEDFSIEKLPNILVHKEGAHYFYPLDENTEDIQYLNDTLQQWVNEERFETFPKISSGNIRDLMQTRKFIVLAIVDENKARHIPPDMLQFRNKIESVIRQKRDIYHKHFQFGWMGNPDLANSLLMQRIPLPYLLVLNSSTYHHHIPDIEPWQMNAEAIEGFLEQIMNRTAPHYGGNSLHINVVRKLFDFKRSLEDMWKGNPVLLAVIFTVPTMFFIVILWACCCADILDAEESDEEDDSSHEKKE